MWSRDSTGTLVEGCFRAAVVYLPAAAPPAAGVTAPAGDNLSKTVGVLTVVSLAVGTAATLAAWGKKQ